MTKEEAIGVLEDVRDAICENIPGNHPELDELREAVQMAVDSLHERKKGKWIHNPDPMAGEGFWHCSVCGSDAYDYTDFCPNCGADMRGET